jgi:predicted nucleic acid-binding Zn ribbon protein
MIFRQKFICDKCGEIECNIHFSEEHKRRMAIIFINCPVCGKAISTSEKGPDEEVGDIINIERVI